MGEISELAVTRKYLDSTEIRRQHHVQPAKAP